VLRAMAKAAVDRSDGQLRVFAGNEFVTDDLLKYIVKRYLIYVQNFINYKSFHFIISCKH
jgi:hypothetical protein